MSVNSTENAVKVFDFYVTPTHAYVVMELLRGGELLDAIMDSGAFSEKDCAQVMFQLFKGLVSIHGRSITHRDLKLRISSSPRRTGSTLSASPTSGWRRR